jgi:NADH-quinone oxidoreductase subunit L
VPFTGGFFSKDAILIEVFRYGGPLAYLLYGLGLVTAFLTSLYTFRMVYLVFGGPVRHTEQLPKVMLVTLIPLAVMAFLGEIINVPVFIGEGALAQFLGPLSPLPKEHSASLELILMAAAGLTSLAGLAVAHFRYSGARREARVAGAESPSALTRFLLNGWYVDDLYRVVFVRPYEAIARFLWVRVDKGGIDGTLYGIGNLAVKTGGGLGRWTTGRVSVYLLSFAAGAAVIVGWLAWS